MMGKNTTLNDFLKHLKEQCTVARKCGSQLSSIEHYKLRVKFYSEYNVLLSDGLICRLIDNKQTGRQSTVRQVPSDNVIIKLFLCQLHRLRSVTKQLLLSAQCSLFECQSVTLSHKKSCRNIPLIFSELAT